MRATLAVEEPCDDDDDDDEDMKFICRKHSEMDSIITTTANQTMTTQCVGLSEGQQVGCGEETVAVPLASTRV